MEIEIGRLLGRLVSAAGRTPIVFWSEPAGWAIVFSRQDSPAQDAEGRGFQTDVEDRPVVGESVDDRESEKSEVKPSRANGSGGTEGAEAWNE